MGLGEKLVSAAGNVVPAARLLIPGARLLVQEGGEGVHRE